MIEYEQWTETGQHKMELETWGLTKLYAGETVLEECTIDQVITLLTYVNEEPDDQKGDEVPFYPLSLDLFLSNSQNLKIWDTLCVILRVVFSNKLDTSRA